MSQQINLFNPIFLKQRKYFTLLTMLQALGLIVAGSLCFYGYAVYQVAQLAKQSEEGSKRLNVEQARFARYAGEFSPLRANQLLQDEVRKSEKDLAEQTKLVATLKSGSVGNTTGYSQYMRAFSRQAIQGLWLTGFKVTGDAAQISLSGGAVNPELLPAYIQRLGKEPAMRGKSFSTLQMQQTKAEAANKSAARYVEFTLYSTPDNEVRK
ncbi:MAG: fimbrial assembly protein [Betaproteobacteria bacterium RBG_16_56_24]|nr:MAG: fimbrial assembly protein [Betaproteobacteria bacterium RBG_16_56_24]